MCRRFTHSRAPLPARPLYRIGMMRRPMVTGGVRRPSALLHSFRGSVAAHGPVSARARSRRLAPSRLAAAAASGLLFPICARYGRSVARQRGERQGEHAAIQCRFHRSARNATAVSSQTWWGSSSSLAVIPFALTKQRGLASRRASRSMRALGALYPLNGLRGSGQVFRQAPPRSAMVCRTFRPTS